MNTLTINLPEDIKFQDNELRNYIQKLETKIDSINDRTKRQTIQIQELQKKIKELEAKR